MPTSKEKTAEKFIELLEIMKKLRGENGCPWDKEQTLESLKTHLIEEAYEVLEAVDQKNPKSLKEELGDLLLQVIFYSQIGSELNQFSIEEVIEEISQKLIRRHPHVFSDVQVKDSKEAIENWEKIKAKEKSKEKDTSLLSGIPSHLPALLKAYRLGQKTSRVGFDWNNIGEVYAKVEEELKEFQEAIKQKHQEQMKEEFGDLLFSLAQTARFLEINPEESLRLTCQKFMNRFRFIEKKLSEQKKELSETSFEELDQLWNDSKKSTTSV